MTLAIAAVAYDKESDFVLEEVRLDELKPDELLVKIEAVGVCHSDVTLKQIQPLPAVFGHEGVGIVEKIGSAVKSVQAGDRVVISYPFCGGCHQCGNHKPFLCDNFVKLTISGARLDGSATLFLDQKPITSACFSQSSFATRAITLENNVVKVDATIPEPQKLAALPCGVITGAGSVFNILEPGQNESLAVFGAGAVGLSAVMAARCLGANPIIVVDVVAERLALAKELGATHVINAKTDVVEEIKAITGHGVSYSFETSGNLQAFNNCVASTEKGGTMAIATTPNITGTFELEGMAFLNQALRLISVQLGDSITREFIPRLIALSEAGEFPYEKLITYYDFHDINQAFKDSHEGLAIKPVLVMPRD
jgi:aryl-alcohol dehydrogenase